MITYKLITWYDTVTEESAKDGEYSEVGQGERVYETHDRNELISWLNSELKSLGDYEGTIDQYDTLTAIDPEINYKTGERYYSNVAINIEGCSSVERRNELTAIDQAIEV